MNISISTVYSWIAYVIMAHLLLRAVGHYLTAYVRNRKLLNIDEQPLAKRLESLTRANLSLNQWHANLKHHWPDHPAARFVLWACEHPYRLSQVHRQQHQLSNDIEKYYSDLVHACRTNITITTPLGLVFTVAGLMLFFFNAKSNLNVDALLQTLGPAMGTTVAGGIIMVLEKLLLKGHLEKQYRELYSIGNHLLDSLQDQLAIYQHKQHKAKQQAKRGSHG